VNELLLVDKIIRGFSIDKTFVETHCNIFKIKKDVTKITSLQEVLAYPHKKI